MHAKAEYTGTHKVILPPDYMNSVEAVCELYEERIVNAAANLDIPGLRLSPTQRVVRFVSAVLGIWLLPAIWLTCL